MEMIKEEQIVYLNDVYSVGVGYREGGNEAQFIITRIDGSGDVLHTHISEEMLGVLSKALDRAQEDLNKL